MYHVEYLRQKEKQEELFRRKNEKTKRKAVIPFFQSNLPFY